MKESKLFGKEPQRPYVIAEIGANHNGNIDLAKKLVEEAKLAGADCAKFQSWSKTSVFAKIKYDENVFLKDDYRNRTDYNLESIVDEYSLSLSEQKEMSDFCNSVGIDFASTPFSEEEVDFLVDEVKVPFVKVASMDLNNYPFLEYIAKTGKPIILSTGLSELFEIDRAVNTLVENGAEKIGILHCVSTYPPADEDINLASIPTLKRIYPFCTIGFSDHSLGTALPIAAAALGADIIEKHFTLDKEMEGWDHAISADRQELQEICSASKRVVRSIGDGRILAPEARQQKIEFRRSIVLKDAVKKGTLISRENLLFKRPGTGISPEHIEFIIGRKAKLDLAADHVIQLEDLA